MIRTRIALGIFAALAVAGSAFGQGAILHDTATVEIVDMPTALAMGAHLQPSRFAFNFNYETGRLALRPERNLALSRVFDSLSLFVDSSPLDAPNIAQDFCSVGAER